MTIKKLLGLFVVLFATSALATEIPLGRMKGVTHPNVPFPDGATCGAGEAIQTIAPSGVAISCIAVGAGQTVPGSDTYVLYNNHGIMGADQYFTWNYTNQILSLGIPGTAGLATFGPGTLADLTAAAPTNGTLAYCSDCAQNTSPCTASSTGAFAQRLNGAWVCGGSGGSALTGSGVANVTAMWTSATNLSTFPVTDDTVPVGNGTTQDAKVVSNCVDTGGNHLNYTAATNSFSCGTSTSGGSGTVTSVGLTLPSSIFSIAGSPVTTSGTLAVTLTGVTSGGIPYFSSTSAIASSALLTGSQFVIGGGAGTAPFATTGLAWDATKQNITHTAGTLGTNDFIYTNSGTLSTGGGVGIGTNVTSAGSSGSAFFEGLNATLAAGYTGTGQTYGAYITSQVANAGSNLQVLLTNPPVLDAAVVGLATRSGTGSGYKVGGHFTALGSTGLDVGVYGQAVANSTAGTLVGIMGVAGNSTEGTNLKNVGGYFDSGGSGALAFNLVNANVALVARSGGAGDYLLWTKGSTGSNETFAVKADGTVTISIGGGVQTGVSATKTVRDAAGTGTCTLVFTSGLLTGGTC